MSDTVLLTTEQMQQADAMTIQAGTPGLDLMEAAGMAVVRELKSTWPEKRPVVILAGPGNNGGDGFVIARLLKDDGWPVALGLLGEIENLKGDALANAKRWDGPVTALIPSLLGDNPLVVDALFGTGLTHDIDGVAAELLWLCGEKNLDVVAVDIPSGIHGDTGAVRGIAAKAHLTVTFFRAKPGHLLAPGRHLCGRVVVADIGINDSVLKDIRPHTFVNAPGLWLQGFPWPRPDSHKYKRGHSVIWGGAEMTGAARLAARAARRIGSGMVTIATEPASSLIYRLGDPGNIVAECPGSSAFEGLLTDSRKNAALIGPGAGVSQTTCDLALAALHHKKALVLDADGITSFVDKHEDLFDAIGQSDCVLTPHDGEFDRLFGGHIAPGLSKVDRAREAAKIAGAVIVLKGPDTVVASPDGMVAINANAPSDLATAGSGDVLAGMTIGLMAQGLSGFRSALAAVWLHGAAAKTVGPGLIAEDLSDALPSVLSTLKQNAIEHGLY